MNVIENRSEGPVVYCTVVEGSIAGNHVVIERERCSISRHITGTDRLLDSVKDMNLSILVNMFCAQMFLGIIPETSYHSW